MNIQSVYVANVNQRGKDKLLRTEKSRIRV